MTHSPVLRHIHTLMMKHQEQLRVQCLNKDTFTRSLNPADQSRNLPVTRRPLGLLGRVVPSLHWEQQLEMSLQFEANASMITIFRVFQ